MRSLRPFVKVPVTIAAGAVFVAVGAASAQQFQPWTTTEKPAAKSAPSVPAASVPAASVPAAKAKPGPSALPATGAQAVQAQPATAAPAPAARMSEWPKLLPKQGEAKLPERWSEAEIADAQKSCVTLLKGLDLVAVGAPPILEGSECGAAAPVELISIGTSPQVTFSPPVTVTCEMAASLHGWITKDVQAAARKHLGAPVVRIDTMSSYSCRNAYGRAHHKLSEHGKANAIDIRAFMTAKADSADVLASWGPTVRDIQAQVAAAKVADEKARALAATKPAAPSGVSGVPPTGTALAPSAPSAVADAPKGPSVIIGTGGTIIPSQTPSIGLSTGFPQPSRLGGPKPVEKLRGTDTGKSAPKVPSPAVDAGSAPVSGDRYTRFLRDVHAVACTKFGTVLGPEANNAHRNHFHVDMAKRQQKSFCE
jgi:hypothetical protein